MRGSIFAGHYGNYIPPWGVIILHIGVGRSTLIVLPQKLYKHNNL